MGQEDLDNRYGYRQKYHDQRNSQYLPRGHEVFQRKANGLRQLLRRKI